MPPPHQISCVVPFFNEGERLLSVLQVLMQVPEIAQVICIDDGSKDKTAKLIKEIWPDIILISLPMNKGKAAAIKHALRVIQCEYVLLMDADLRFLNYEEIQQAIAIIQECSIDMLILRRITAPWFFKIDRRDVLFSGERILKKEDLQKTLQHKVSGYQLEIAINRYMLQQKKKVRWVAWSASNTHKIKKWGLAYGVRREIGMFREMIIYSGFMEYLKQILFFARKRVGMDSKIGSC